MIDPVVVVFVFVVDLDVVVVWDVSLKYFCNDRLKTTFQLELKKVKAKEKT